MIVRYLVISPATNASLSSISFRGQDILKMIHSLGIDKAHGFDDTSGRLFKISNFPVERPLSIIL